MEQGLTHGDNFKFSSMEQLVLGRPKLIREDENQIWCDSSRS